jgi:hypothetical protein
LGREWMAGGRQGQQIKLAHRHTWITHLGPEDKAKGVRSVVTAFDDYQVPRTNIGLPNCTVTFTGK